MPAVQTNLCNLDPHRLKTSSWQSRLLQTPTHSHSHSHSHSVSIRVQLLHLDISFRPGVLAERAPQYNNYVTECITLKRIKGRLVLKDGAELSHRLRQPNYDML